MKKLIALTIVIISFLTYTTAHDCDMVWFDLDWNFKLLEDWEYDNILPQEAISQAMVNLKWFCCEKKLPKLNTCDQDGSIDQDGIYPSSVYLYDHIIDVSMRRLDAKQKNDNWEDLIYWLDPDVSWLEWRTFITDHANNKNGSIPLAISEKFKETREAQWNSLKSWKPYSEESVWDISDFEDYDERRLVEKFLWVCETSMYLYENLASNIDKTILNTPYLACERMSNIRIKKEIDYTKAILMQKGNKFLYNNVKSYLDTYFSQNKLIALKQLIFNIKNTFNEINKAVPELVPNCS